MAVKIAILIVFFAVMILVGIRARKKVTGVNDFVMGGRSIGPWMTAFSYGTSYFSAVVFIGYAGQFGWKFGISSTWIGIGNALIGSLLAWIILGRRTRVMTKHLSSATMPDFFGKRFDSKALKIAASAIAFVFLIPYTASVYNGLSRLFALAFDIPYWVCVVVMAVLTGIYVILGGYMATSVNDFIQGIIMLVGIIAVIASVLAGKGGFTAALFGLAQIAPEASEGLASAPGIFSSFFGPDPSSLLGVVILTSLGTWGLPQMVQKFYAIKDEKAVKKGTIVSTAFAFVVAGGSYFLGGFGRLFSSEAAAAGLVTESGVAYDGIIPLMLQSALSDILIGVVVVLVLSASMSTLSSLVLTSSSTLTLDLIRGTIVKDMSQKKQLVFIRVFVLFFIALSVIIALDPPAAIAQLMGISWGALAGAFLAPFLYGLYWKKVTRAAVWASFVFGIGITVSNLFLKFVSPIDAGALAMIGGLVIVPIVSLITGRGLSKEAGRIDGIFECYNEKVLVRKAEQLASEE